MTSATGNLPQGRHYTVGCLMRSDVRECFLLWEVEGYLWNSIPGLRTEKASNC